jgi:hypothetical protein
MKKLPGLNIDFRLVLGVALIAGSLVSAHIISQSTTRMVKVWSAVNNLAPGEVIEESDITISRVSLSDSANMYLDGEQSIIGTSVVRAIKSAELIPAYSLAQDASLDLHVVPISVSSLRLPDGVNGGSIVDIYGIPRNSATFAGNIDSKNGSKLLLADISVDSINRESSRLGGDIGLSILVPVSQVGEFIKSFSEFEFVLVKLL